MRLYFVKKKLLVALLFLLVTTSLVANHLVGGTMSYECLGNDQYKVTLTIYRDCSSSTPFDTDAPISVYNGSSLLSTTLVPFVSSSTVPIIINNPCLITSPSVCVEKSEYELIINLPPIAGGYQVVYQRCCRNSNAVNIVSPSSMGATYKVHIPEQNIASCNNSPVFNNPPPTTMCVGYQFTYDLSATDLDGDSLVYNFGDAINGGTTLDPAPNPAVPPPYNNITWNTGYSTNYQIDANPLFTINPVTGFLSGTPTNAGFYTFSIKVEEYRNGVYIDEIYRDFILIITNCASNTVADFPTQLNYCDGLTLNFTNTSLNATYFYWDFGDPSTISDTSNLSLPSYTYADTGVYNIMMVANPGYFCEDTIFRQFQIYPKILPSYTPINNQCLLNNQFELYSLGNHDNNGIVTWSFGGNTNPLTQIGDTVQTLFLDTGFQVVTLTIEDNGCIETYIDSVRILPNPIADMSSQTIFCDGLTYQFNNTSQFASAYSWNFGVTTINSDTSHLISPQYLYPDSGVFNTMLIANQMDLCFDTVVKPFVLHQDFDAEFVTETHCLSENNFTLLATGSFNSLATYNWDLGTVGVPTTSSNQQVFVTYPDTGYYPIELTVQNFGCTKVFTDSVRILPNPIAKFSVDTNLGCQPLTISFFDSSYAWSDMSYVWNFGNQILSNDTTPINTYLNPGIYYPYLTIITDTGCIDTVVYNLPTGITVNPKPQANFSINTNEIYFMNHIIELEDLSNELIQEFNMGDGTYYLDRNIAYEYADSGHYDINQIVENQFGCKDTLSKKVWVKPDLLVFIPNTFTPNGDNLNDIFLPKIRGVIEYEIQLFNRWGELYFSSKDLNIGWDGTYKNKPCPIGVYNWKVKVKTVDYLTPTYIGHINLMR